MQDASSDAAASDGPIDAGPELPHLGPAVELGLLPPLEDLPYNHSAEVQLAVSGDRVAAAYLNMRFLSAGEFDTDDTFFSEPIRNIFILDSVD